MFTRKVILRALICAMLSLVPFTTDPENQLYDLKVKILSKTHFQKPQSVLLVEVTKDDFEELRKKFPSDIPLNAKNSDPWKEKFEALRGQFFWDDQVYEGLLKKVLSENPKRFLITFFYSENLVLLSNKAPLQRWARDPRVLWASQFDLDMKLLKPAPELTGTENYGFANVSPDPDSVVRRAFLVQKNHISLPFRALVDDLDSFHRGMDLTEPFLIRYKGGPGYVQSCRVMDLFAEKPEDNHCGSLKDRYVILTPSTNAVAGANLYRTPVGYMGRGEVLANILLTAMNENATFAVSKYLLFLAIFAHALAMASVILQSGARKQMAFIFYLLVGETILSLLALRFLALQIPLVPFVFVTIISYFVFAWLKFAQQESKRWQAEKKAQYLRELDELKSNFMSLMSHDLKTPIAKVQALTERLNREASTLTAEQKNILQSIQKSNDELGNYILSILNFQRIESQELKPHKKSTDINLLIEEVVKRLETLAQDRNISLTMELEPMFAVEIDEQQIKQVLTNLIENAIKYNNAGTNVVVKSADLSEQVEVRVEDNGVGIDPKQMDRLFKKFSRFEKGTSERVKGTGLGLYLAKYFIELHGGHIEVESKLGEGTKFRFTLPVSTG